MFTYKVMVTVVTLVTSFIFVAPTASAEAPTLPIVSVLQIATVSGAAGSLAL